MTDVVECPVANAPWTGCVMGYPLGVDKTCGMPTVSEDAADEGYLWCPEHLAAVASETGVS